MRLLGFRVVVITNPPVYVRGELARPRDVEVRSCRIPLARVLYRSMLGRLLVYLVFSALSFTQLLRIRGVSVLYSRGPHPFTDVPCILYKVVRGGG